MRIPKNIIRAFTGEEPIAGLEISGSFVRLVLLEKNDETGQFEVKLSAEEPVPEGTILDGEIKNLSLLEKALKNLQSKLRFSIINVIVSVPPNFVYTKILNFPYSITGEKLGEAIDLAVNFQLPFSPSEMYVSWEINKQETGAEVSLAAVPRKAVDAFLEIFKKLKFYPVAMEPHSLSLTHIAAFPKDKSVFVKTSDLTSSGIFIFKNKLLRFSRVLNSTFPKKDLADEFLRIKDYYESTGELISEEFDLKIQSLPLENIYQNLTIGKKDKKDWLFALGAAARGLIPREDDNLISLLPISTQTAYEHEKAVNFASFLSNLTVGLVLFFSLAFIGVWVLVSTAQQKTVKQLEALGSVPISPEIAQTEQKAQEVNSLIKASSQIVKGTVVWSRLLDELKQKVEAGIVITNLNLSSPEGVMSLAGVAADRNSLNAFKKRMESSEILTEIKLPLTNLEQRERIPFTISFQLKDPKSIYYK